MAAEPTRPDAPGPPDPDAVRAALRELAEDVQAVYAGLATGSSAELETARARLRQRGIDPDAALDDLAELLRALNELGSEASVSAAAARLRRLATALDADGQSTGRRIDALIARLERDWGPRIGHDPKREALRRQADYLRSARSAIADSLRSVGITPLSSAEPDPQPPAPSTGPPPGDVPGV